MARGVVAEVTAERPTLLAAVGLLVVAGGLPLLAMIVASLTTPDGSTFAAYASLVDSTRPWILLLRSLAVGAIAAAWALAIGWPIGVLCERTDLPGRGVLTLVLCVPFFIPTYINAVAWALIFGHGSLVARLTGDPAGVASLLFSLGGCGFVLGSCFAPLMLILTRASLRTVDPRLEEAARLTAGWPATLRGITLPLAFPGTVLAASLVFLLAAGDLAVPMYLRTDVFPTASFSEFAAAYRFDRATALAIPLAVLAFLVLRVEARIVPEQIASLRLVASNRSRSRISLGRARWPIAALLYAVAAALVVLPLGALLRDALAPGALADAWRRAGDSAVRSVVWAAAGASLLTILGFLLGYLIQRRALRTWRWADRLSLFLFATPSTVLGIGLVALWNHRPTNWIYATPIVVMLGFVAQFSAVAGRICANAIAAIPFRLEEAAQLAGASWWRRMLCIVVPLAGSGLAAAWLASFLFCFRDLGISMIVYPPGADTLPVRTFTLMANGAPPLVAALCAMMIVAAIGPLLLLGAMLRQLEER